MASLPDCAAVDRSLSISLDEEGSGIAQHSSRHMLLRPAKDFDPLVRYRHPVFLGRINFSKPTLKLLHRSVTIFFPLCVFPFV